MKQKCSVIVRWHDFTPFKRPPRVIDSFPRLSDFTGVKHSKYSIKLTTKRDTENLLPDRIKNYSLYIDSRKSRFRVVCERAIVL